MSTYLTLNACRVLAYLETGQILSKAEGGDWALKSVPAKFRPTVRQALKAYWRSADHKDINPSSVRDFAKFAHEKVRTRFDKILEEAPPTLRPARGGLGTEFSEGPKIRMCGATDNRAAQSSLTLTLSPRGAKEPNRTG